MTKYKFINPYDYEALFHIVSNLESKTDGEHAKYLKTLINKVGNKGTTHLNINKGIEKGWIEEVKESARHAENQKDLDFYLETIRGMRL